MRRFLARSAYALPDAAAGLLEFRPTRTHAEPMPTCSQPGIGCHFSPIQAGFTHFWRKNDPCLTISADSSSTTSRVFARGGVAQLVERLLCKQNVAGSIPVASTIFFNRLDGFEEWAFSLGDTLGIRVRRNANCAPYGRICSKAITMQSSKRRGTGNIQPLLHFDSGRSRYRSIANRRCSRYCSVRHLSRHYPTGPSLSEATFIARRSQSVCILI
jgi:hypothetical protein